jgi:hypothetical protein
MRFPRQDQRLAIIGRTGSGKTQAAAWFLSHTAFDRMPWYIVDYKYDELLNSIRGIEEVNVNRAPPRAPGIYVVHPLPTEETQVEDFLWRVWEKGKAGVYVDEGQMLPDKGAYKAIQTQGRSLRIPTITLTQRPSRINRFIISEADFYLLFRIVDNRDRKTIEEFVPLDMSITLPKYQSIYHDVGDEKTEILLPVPQRDDILERFSARMPSRWFGRRVQKGRR